MSTATEAEPQGQATGTRVLRGARATLERLLPGLDARLADVPLEELESPDGPAIGIFRESDGPALLVPESSEGVGARATEAIAVQRAIGSRAPSLAIATTMHHFSLATLVELARRESGLETLLLQAVARNHSLVASGFAEGRTGQSILDPTMEARRNGGGGWLVSGTKKPCSLSRSADLLTASVTLGDEDRIGVALIPADGDGIERSPFWGSLVLRGAESDELTLVDVEVPDQLIFEIERSADGRLDELTADGFVWFELLIAASYLGMASGLAERAIEGEKGDVHARVEAVVELEAAAAALESVARELDDGERGEGVLGRALMARYAVQSAIARTSPVLVECLGGMGFIASPAVAYLYAAARALAFHPPSLMKMSDRLAAYLAGGELTVA